MRQMAPVKASANRSQPFSHARASQMARSVDLASFFVRAPAALVLLDPDLKILMVSESLAELLRIFTPPDFRKDTRASYSIHPPSIEDPKTRRQNWPGSTQLRDCRGTPQLALA